MIFAGGMSGPEGSGTVVGRMASRFGPAESEIMRSLRRRTATIFLMIPPKREHVRHAQKRRDYASKVGANGSENG